MIIANTYVDKVIVPELSSSGARTVALDVVSTSEEGSPFMNAGCLCECRDDIKDKLN